MTGLSPMTGLPSATTVTASVVPPELDNGEGLHMRSAGQGNRARKASLSDGVPVERISDLDPQEPFDEATKELNQEIRQRKLTGNGRVHQE